ncbi:MAG: hypothetical protein Tsb0034_08180 [Ekhidna sp.]
MLIILHLKEDAYLNEISNKMESHFTRKISIGALHSVLKGLQNKEYVLSSLSLKSPVRGGRQKRVYRISKTGKLALNLINDLKSALWEEIEK